VFIQDATKKGWIHGEAEMRQAWKAAGAIVIARVAGGRYLIR
jgi:hypothetical protein